jgi:hypothetical protein
MRSDIEGSPSLGLFIPHQVNQAVKRYSPATYRFRFCYQDRTEHFWVIHSLSRLRHIKTDCLKTLVNPEVLLQITAKPDWMKYANRLKIAFHRPYLA